MAAFDMSPKKLSAGRVRDLIREVAGSVFGAQVVEVPIPGFSVFTDRQLDDPLAGARAALFVRNVGKSQVIEYARAARAAGRSWDEIGAALELPEREFTSRGEATFLWLVEGCEPESDPDALPSFRTPATRWRCGTCEQPVTDHGPFESHPDDNEPGHALDCARHSGDVDAWRVRVGGEQ